VQQLSIRVYTTIRELKQQLDHDRTAGMKIGFVPTMGALHEGHLSLIRQALSENDRVVCSIFVNPTQFNDPADLDRYPRMPEKDITMLEESGCQYVFLPAVSEMYPEGEATLNFQLGEITSTMEGVYRPGHFNGVATIVDRLFNYVQPHTAYFGEKDFQQLAVIRRMTQLRNHSVRIKGCPTLREPDGLAMSSRNMLLTEAERKAAPLIYQGLTKAQEFIPHLSVDALKHMVIRYIEQSPLLKVQYLEFVDPGTLVPVTDWNQQPYVQACIAVLTSGPRLIDNIQLDSTTVVRA
jgi:pantoate--beta-alanine ligase